jgi:hypothetical protein
MQIINTIVKDIAIYTILNVNFQFLVVELIAKIVVDALRLYKIKRTATIIHYPMKSLDKDLFPFLFFLLIFESKKKTKDKIIGIIKKRRLMFKFAKIS